MIMIMFWLWLIITYFPFSLVQPVIFLVAAIIFSPVFIPIVIVKCVLLSSDLSKSNYLASEYHRILQIPYNDIKNNKHKKCKYLIYSKLSRLTGRKKFIFNLNIPTEDENVVFDVVMINRKGVYFFLSRNYDGNIEGREDDSFWVQITTIENEKHKERFLNPLMQNRNTFNKITEYLKNRKCIYFYVVFGEKSKLENLVLNSERERAVNLNDLTINVRNDMSAYDDYLTESDITDIYNMLANAEKLIGYNLYENAD